VSTSFLRHPRRLAVAGALLAGATLAPRALLAQRASRIPVQAGATLERDSVTVGDVVRLVVRVRAPRGATINFPSAVDSLGPVQSLEPPTVRDGSDTLDATDRIATYRLAAWDVGTLPIRLGDVLVQTDDDERQVLLTLPSLTVRSVLPADSAQRIPKPARPLLPVQAPVPWWWWLIAAIAALMIGLGAWWWRRRRAAALAPPGDPFGDAEHEFERIDRLRLVDAGEAGRHAALTADVMRRYLAERVEHASLALTSAELMAALRGAPGVPLDRVQRLLGAVDPIKFGAAPVSPADARALGVEARAIVRAEHEHAVAVEAAAAAARGQEAAA
jgi:hypothetical protein